LHTIHLFLLRAAPHCTYADSIKQPPINPDWLSRNR